MTIRYSYFVAVSNFFFILLYPGFAIYNVIVAYGFVPPVLGGFFGLLSIFYLFLMLPVFLNLNIFFSDNTKYYFIFIILFFIYLIYISLVNIVFDARAEIILSFIQTIEALVFIFTAFLMGFFLDLNKKLYNLFVFFIIVSSLLLLAYVVETGSYMFYAKELSDTNVADAVSTYQGFGRSAMIVSLVTLSMTNRLGRYLVFYLLSIFVLFIIGSRSELVGVFFSGGLLVFMKFKMNFTRVIQLLLFLTIGLVSIIIASIIASEYFSSSRNFQLLNVSEASSWIARQNLETIAINQIKEYPVSGYFAGHIIEGGLTGNYVHNILSVWAGFGLIPLFLYGLLCFTPVLDCTYLLFKEQNRSDKFYLCFVLSATVLLLIIFSKSIFWFIPGMAWGLYLNVKKSVYEN